MSLDIKDHFLATPTNDPEILRIKHRHVPADIVKRYIIDEFVTKDEWIYVKIQKGMPGLRQAATLAYYHLKNCLKPFGCTPVTRTTGTWKHAAHKKNPLLR